MIRSLLKYLLDLLVWVAVVPLAYLIRLDTGVLDHVGSVLVYTGATALVKVVALAAARLHRQTWHRVGLRDLWPLGILVSIVFVVEVVLIQLVLAGPILVPRSVPVIEAMGALLGLAALRFGARLYYEERGVLRVRLRGGSIPRRVLIAGAGEAGVRLARELLRHPEGSRRPVAFLDDDPAKRGRTLAGLKVIGPIHDVKALATRHDVDELIVAIPSADGAVMREILRWARDADIEHRTLPSFRSLVEGDLVTPSLREIDVEDLLRRTAVRMDVGPVSDYLAGRRVLITGAGGSIGSEIVRQVAAVDPGELLLLGRGENSIFGIDRELARRFPELSRQALICDVRDEGTLRAVFERFRPEVVFHAAAHKHVPLMEANPEQAVWNNVVGTQNLVRLALEFGVERLVNVSTDKAVNPTSVMGVSKRVAEMIVAAGAEHCASGCAMVSVRFGNVLGSRGSVVPVFREQIARGGPVTVTDPAMTRYFMTIPEASQLVLQAGAIAENGRVYVLDMGEPVRIVDLARDLILLSGLEPDRDIEITFTGMRPGEKLFEELLTAEEGTDASSHAQIFVARRPAGAADVDAALASLFETARDRDGAGIREAFAALVPSYSGANPPVPATAVTKSSEAEANPEVDLTSSPVASPGVPASTA